MTVFSRVNNTAIIVFWTAAAVIAKSEIIVTIAILIHVT